MSDSTSTSIIYIKEEVDTSYTSTVSCCSPSTSTNNDLNRASNNSYSRSNSISNVTKSSSTKNYGEQKTTSRSVSPERQLCSSTTTLSTDLNSVHLNHDNTNAKSDAQNGSEQSAKSSVAGTSSIRDEMRRLCLVCGDVASGFHYGVASCEACKAFFKRTIQGNIEYTCPANNECEINKRRRKACQACRFQKCLLMGMLKEGVRLDRVRGGRQKYRRNPITNSYQTMQLLYQSNSTSLEDVKILEVLNTYEPETLAVHSQKQSTIKLTNKDKSNMIDIKQETINSTKSHTNSKASNVRNNNNDSQEVLTMLSDLYDKELVSVIGWAKQLPGFTDLPLNDQMKLLQISWTEILTLQLIFRSLPFNGKFCFATDFWMDEIIAKDCGYITFYYHCVQIAQRLERLAPRREEYYLLKALILSNCDIYLDDQSSLRAFRDSILNSLNDVVYLQRNSAAVSHQQQLLLLLPSLRQSDSILRLFWLNIEREGIVKMKKLFVEMLEPIVR